MFFKDEYFSLSTFHRSPFTMMVGDKLCEFLCIEAAYQAQKVPHIADKFSQVQGLEAKRLDKTLKITRDNWEDYKLYAMANALHAKYSNKLNLIYLKKIKDDIIFENDFKDSYWGYCVKTKQGKNYLGKMLQFIRDNDNDLNKLYTYIKEDLLGE